MAAGLRSHRKELGRAMDGQITLEQRCRPGTKFQVSLPIKWQESQAAYLAPNLISTTEPSKNPLNVLLVEDNQH
ncbi:hypothetical protein O9929_23490 [Vibrio lentus]|nr:hypothetical protein [Vibrio lentus]